jgi:hypothetical protein
MTLLQESPVSARPALPGWPVRVVGVLILVLYQLGVVVQPPPDGPDPGPTGWSDILFWLVQTGLLVVLAGVLTGRSWTLWAGLAAGILLLGQSISCPLRGHHEFAPWWFAQLAIGILTIALPAGLLLQRAQASANAG